MGLAQSGRVSAEINIDVVNHVGNNLGTITPKHRGKRGSRADQQAGRINKMYVQALSATPPSPVQIRAAPPIFFGSHSIVCGRPHQLDAKQ